jgi:site-specific recombinase XerD
VAHAAPNLRNFRTTITDRHITRLATLTRLCGQPHNRVTAITDLLTQGIPLEDVQYLAGHAEPRTTGLYDRRQKKVTRNIVERISI